MNWCMGVLGKCQVLIDFRHSFSRIFLFRFEIACKIQMHKKFIRFATFQATMSKIEGSKEIMRASEEYKWIAHPINSRRLFFTAFILLFVNHHSLRFVSFRFVCNTYVHDSLDCLVECKLYCMYTSWWSGRIRTQTHQPNEIYRAQILRQPNTKWNE